MLQCSQESSSVQLQGSSLCTVVSIMPMVRLCDCAEMFKSESLQLIQKSPIKKERRSFRWSSKSLMMNFSLVWWRWWFSHPGEFKGHAETVYEGVFESRHKARHTVGALTRNDFNTPSHWFRELHNIFSSLDFRIFFLNCVNNILYSVLTNQVLVFTSDAPPDVTLQCIWASVMAQKGDLRFHSWHNVMYCKCIYIYSIILTSQRSTKCNCVAFQWAGPEDHLPLGLCCSCLSLRLAGGVVYLLLTWHGPIIARVIFAQLRLATHCVRACWGCAGRQFVLVC